MRVSEICRFSPDASEIALGREVKWALNATGHATHFAAWLDREHVVVTAQPQQRRPDQRAAECVDARSSRHALARRCKGRKNLRRLARLGLEVGEVSGGAVVPVYMIDIHEGREVSNHVEERTGVTHVRTFGAPSTFIRQFGHRPIRRRSASPRYR